MKLSTVGVEKKIDELVAEGARQTEALTNIATYMKEFLKITQGVDHYRFFIVRTYIK